MPLHDPAMDLSLEQKRVDSAAEIVDDGVAFDGDDTGVGIDLDLGRCGSRWERSVPATLSDCFAEHG